MDLFKNLEHFLRPDSKAELDFKNLTKELFDNAKRQKINSDGQSSSNQMTSLVIDHMDDEGIWSQLDIENQLFLKNYVKEFCQNEKPDEEDNFVANDSEVYDTDGSMDEEDLNDDSDLDEENDLDAENELDEENELEQDGNLDDEEENLNDEEESSNDEENLLDEMNSDEFDEEEDDDTLFNPSKSNQVNYDKELEELDEKSEEEEEEKISEFQKNVAQTEQKVKELEDEFLKEKPWQLKGEVSAHDRPQGSLLEEYVDFESGARPLPVYTEEFTKKLEDIILQRVKTNKFDSVEQKERKQELPFDYRRRILLETEQNKDGLAKVYENEYLKQKGVSQKDENPLHKEIKDKMRKLFVQLDSLCNFNYVPKAANSEIKVINNLPAINVEEAIPVAVSDANLVAPQEILPIQKSDLKSDIEKSKTDKLRARRLKKKLIKEKIKFKEQNGQLSNFKKFKSATDDKVKKSAKDSETVKNVFMKTRKSR